MHEQNNKLIKPDKGVIEILDSTKVLLMRMISVLVIASVITKVNLNIIKAKSSYENSQRFE